MQQLRRTQHSHGLATSAPRLQRAGAQGRAACRVGLLSAVLCSALAASATCYAAATPVEERFSAKGKRNRGDVLVLGSSSINGVLGHALVDGLRRRGFAVYKLGVGSSGLGRPDYFDWRARAAALPVTKRTALALVYIGGNAAQAIRTRSDELPRWRRRWTGFGHPAWSKRYTARVAEFARALCARGVRQVVFLPPPDVGNRRLQRRLAKVRSGQRRGAARVRCARVVRTRGDLRRILAERVASPRAGARRGRRKRRPRLRQPDGVHMTRAGAAVLWRRVRQQVLRRANLGVKQWQRDERRARLRAQRLARKRLLRRQRLSKRPNRQRSLRQRSLRQRSARKRAQQRAKRRRPPRKRTR